MSNRRTRSRDAANIDLVEAFSDQPEEIRPSWDLSTVFGAAIVAAGGYHLALRPSDRFPRRWTPARTEADRSGRRRFGSPTR